MIIPSYLFSFILSLSLLLVLVSVTGSISSTATIKLTPNSPIIAIDYGSDWLKLNLVSYESNSIGSHSDTVINEQSNRKTPALIGFDSSGAELYGESAESLLVRSPTTVFPQLKRLLGAGSTDSTAVKLYLTDFPHHSLFINPTNNRLHFTINNPTIATAAHLGSITDGISIDELSALLFQQAKRLSTQHARSNYPDPAVGNIIEINQSILTVPDRYTTADRELVSQLLTIAGIEPKIILNELTAAGIDYAVRNYQFTDTNTAATSEYIIIFGSGSSSSAAALIEITQTELPTELAAIKSTARSAAAAAKSKAKNAKSKANQKRQKYGNKKGSNNKDTDDNDNDTNDTIDRSIHIKVLAVHSNPSIGGFNYDLLLRDELKSRFNQPLTVKANNKLLKESRELKEQLSVSPSIPVNIEELIPGKDFQVNIKQLEFNSIIDNSKLNNQLLQPLKELLSQTELPINKVKAIELFGGTVRIPAVQAAIIAASSSYNIPIGKHIDGDDGAVNGAAHYAAVQAGLTDIQHVTVDESAVVKQSNTESTALTTEALARLTHRLSIWATAAEKRRELESAINSVETAISAGRDLISESELKWSESARTVTETQLNELNQLIAAAVTLLEDSIPGTINAAEYQSTADRIRAADTALRTAKELATPKVVPKNTKAAPTTKPTKKSTATAQESAKSNKNKKDEL